LAQLLAQCPNVGRRTARKPVGYQSDFLDSYNSNETFYLSESLRRQLKMMGDTGRESLPAGTFGHEIMNRLLIDLYLSQMSFRLKSAK
jgi:hypothetical protein